MNALINQNEINVGVDTGKHFLDIHINPLDIFFTVENNGNGIKEAISELKKYNPTRIAIEATGRLEYEFVLACTKAKLNICVVNPVKIKRFAGAIGQQAKTDKLDARLIANFAEKIKPDLYTIKPEQIQLMSDLLSRRRQLMSMQTMEKNRLQSMPKSIALLIKPVLTTFKNLIAKVDAKLLKLIEQCNEYKSTIEIMQSMPGIGNVVSFSLLSDMPELGYMTNKQASSMIGVAPINRESGSYTGKSMIRGGRSKIRTVMYMAMMSAIQCNPVFKEKYHSMVTAGKPKKVAIIACVRKMIVILNSMVRDGVKWESKCI
jgi:transposase